MTASSGDSKIKVLVDPDIAELVPDFLKRRDLDVREIKEASAAGNFERLRTIGHQMKGSGAGYGFKTISDLGAEIENEAKSRNAERTLQLAEQLGDYLKRIEIVYE